MPNRFRNAALIYNPLAGRRRWKRERDIERAARLLAAYQMRCTRVPTIEAGSATVLARRELAAGRDLIIVCGGDGTINEVVNGMAGSQVPLAILPAGTGNVLAKELGLPWSIWRAAEYIPHGAVRRIALGRAGSRYFICMAGAGADANIVYHLNQTAKLRLGMLSYWLESFRQYWLYDFSAFTVRIGAETLESALLLVSRTRHYGGPIQITRHADLFGNDFEVCVFPPRPRFFYLIDFLATQFRLLERFGSARFLRACEVRAEARADRIHVQTDGELAGRLPMDFALVPDALSLLVPARAG